MAYKPRPLPTQYAYEAHEVAPEWRSLRARMKLALVFDHRPEILTDLATGMPWDEVPEGTGAVGHYSEVGFGANKEGASTDSTYWDRGTDYIWDRTEPRSFWVFLRTPASASPDVVWGQNTNANSYHFYRASKTLYSRPGSGSWDSIGGLTSNPVSELEFYGNCVRHTTGSNGYMDMYYNGPAGYKNELKGPGTYVQNDQEFSRMGGYTTASLAFEGTIYCAGLAEGLLSEPDMKRLMQDPGGPARWSPKSIFVFPTTAAGADTATAECVSVAFVGNDATATTNLTASAELVSVAFVGNDQHAWAVADVVAPGAEALDTTATTNLTASAECVSCAAVVLGTTATTNLVASAECVSSAAVALEQHARATTDSNTFGADVLDATTSLTATAECVSCGADALDQHAWASAGVVSPAAVALDQHARASANLADLNSVVLDPTAQNQGAADTATAEIVSVSAVVGDVSAYLSLEVADEVVARTTQTDDLTGVTVQTDTLVALTLQTDAVTAELGDK